jgi:cyclopropane fatty-acyl-phospholipid synthase-like methyltransferase
MMNKPFSQPFSQSCENNKHAILAVLKSVFSDTQRVLEVGSGTGQHAVHFAKHLAHLEWKTSDLTANHTGINRWLDAAALENISPPLSLDLNEPWPITSVDGIFTANTLHIVSWPLVIIFLQSAAAHLEQGGNLCIYGPFNYHGKFTNQSNADFDIWLKNIDASRGIRDIESVIALAEPLGLVLTADHAMPANNRLLVFMKD